MPNKPSNMNQNFISVRVTLSSSHEMSTYPSKAGPFFLNCLNLKKNILWYI